MTDKVTKTPLFEFVLIVTVTLFIKCDIALFLAWSADGAAHGIDISASHANWIAAIASVPLCLALRVLLPYRPPAFARPALELLDSWSKYSLPTAYVLCSLLGYAGYIDNKTAILIGSALFVGSGVWAGVVKSGRRWVHTPQVDVPAYTYFASWLLSVLLAGRLSNTLISLATPFTIGKVVPGALCLAFITAGLYASTTLCERERFDQLHGLWRSCSQFVIVVSFVVPIIESQLGFAFAHRVLFDQSMDSMLPDVLLLSTISGKLFKSNIIEAAKPPAPQKPNK